MRHRIVIVDGHEMVRAGIRAMLERMSDVEVVGEAVDTETAKSLCADLAPDIIMVDESIPLLEEMQPARRAGGRSQRDCKVVVCSAQRQQRSIERAFRAGASGYLLKDSPASEVVIALRTVQRGEIYISPKAAEVLAKGYLRSTASSLQRGGLSSRERDVLQLLVDGKTNRDISGQLKISVKTVETHRARLMEKLNIFSIAELTKYAIREGLTSLES